MTNQELQSLIDGAIADISAAAIDLSNAINALSDARKALDPVTPPPPPPPPAPVWPYKSTIGISDGSSPTAATYSETKAIAGTKPLLRLDCYALGSYAAPIDTALSQTIQVWCTVWGTWRRSTDARNDTTGNPAGVTTKRNTAAWAGEVAKVYKGRILGYELINEPDLNQWLPAEYASFFADAAVAIKTADPAAKVSTAGFFKGVSAATKPQEFAKAIVAELNNRGRKDLLDYFAIHPYDPVGWNNTDSLWHMAFPYGDLAAGYTIREILDAGGFANVPIISTEYGDGGSDQAAQAAEIQAKLGMIKPGFLAAGFVYKMVRSGAFPQDALLNTDGTRRQAWAAVQAKVAAT